MWTRRDFLEHGVLVAGAAALRQAGKAADATDLVETLRRLESSTGGGRLGVWMVDTGSGRTAGYKQTERFAMCSTFKMLLAAQVLRRVDRGEERLDRSVAIPKTGILSYSPVVDAHKGGTLTVGELCQAAVTRSDNQASNLLLKTVGGPSGLTQFTGSLGDRVTRLDRTEPTLNEAKPGDPRDTTSPESILADWRKLLLGDVLLPGSRERLAGWLVGNQTGGERLRKGLGGRAGWRIGDKTGSSDETCNDIAIVWPAGPDGGRRAPVLVAAFLTQCPRIDAIGNSVIAEVGRLAGQWIG